MKLLVKLLVHGVLITALLVGLTDASFTGAILTALGIGIVAYLVGDLYILPRTSNMMATIADAGLVFVMLWIIGGVANWTLNFSEVLLIAVLAGSFEYLYHMWLRGENLFKKRQRAS
ncbi:DUF2512 family protein [Paenibacillus lautus]|uniref:DUF2512 family protein n=1 Tax=Paenibacillus lautus TaxID=1401 RepID=UPI002DBEC962|nr:DUF2512 family protein [Paenibacillus lautus]MEC0207309.1 DUF2512 family protein [Paenibacillus lautus]